MSKVLAPSNFGAKSHSVFGEAFWGTRDHEPTIRVTRSPTLVRSYRGPTTKSDGVLPTNYIRMISRLTPGGSVDAYNSTYRYKSRFGITVSTINNPHGCNVANGSVECPDWMLDRVVLDALGDMNHITANILEDLAQLHKTGVMVVDIFTTICALYRDARKGLWWKLRRAFRQKGVNIPRHMANGWLMYFYGIKPLIGTIDALCGSQDPVYKIFKTRKRQEISVDPRSYTTAGYWVTFNGKAKIQTQCQLMARIKLDSNLAYWNNLGYTSSRLTDAVVTAWALLPYSFVVDWIIPVEAFLRTRVWSPFLEYQGGFTGVRHDVKSQFVDLWPWSGNWPYSGQLPRGNLQVRFYKRVTYPYTVPSSGLSIRLTLSPTQIASAVALAIR